MRRDRLSVAARAYSMNARSISRPTASAPPPLLPLAELALDEARAIYAAPVLRWLSATRM
jgi:hypothetical protein